MGHIVNIEEYKNLKRKINPTKNQIVWGDCEWWLKFIPDNSIDLIYIDPPFYSNQPHEIIWGNGYEKRQFNDRWSGGIEHYINWMKPKIQQAKRVLKKTGSILLHCDWHASHRLRCLLDDVFEAKNFVNEIIWYYGGNSDPSTFFARKHDTILWYSKSSEHRFNKIFKPYSEATKKRYNHKDNKGRYKISTLNGKTEKKYMKKGCPVQSVWSDIPIVRKKREKIGYRTQKPEKLIKRIIQCTSSQDDIVLDFFGGGGTTASCAIQLNRKFIIGDISPVACRVMAKRLNKMEDSPVFDFFNIPKTKEEWLNVPGHEFAQRMCEFKGWECNEKKSNDGGIDGWAENKEKQAVPIQIKNKKIAIGRPEIQRFFGAIRKYKEGIFVGWEFSKPAKEEVAKIERNENKKITLIKVAEDILKDILIDSQKRQKFDTLYKEKTQKWQKKETERISGIKKKQGKGQNKTKIT